MTDASTTRTQTTTYLVQFLGGISGKWILTADNPFDSHEAAQAWTDERIQGRAHRIIKRTITDEIVAEREEVA